MKTVLLVSSIFGLIAVAYVTAQNATAIAAASANASAAVGNGTANASIIASATLGNATVNASTSATATLGNATVNASTSATATLGNGTANATIIASATLGNATVNASTSAAATLGNGTATGSVSLSVNGVSVNASATIAWKPLYDYLLNTVNQTTCTTACPAGQVCRKRVTGFNLQCGAGSGVGNNYTSPVIALASVTTKYAALGLQYGLWLATKWPCILWKGVNGCPGNPLALTQGCYCAYNVTAGPMAYNNATSSCVPIYSCTQGSFSFY